MTIEMDEFFNDLKEKYIEPDLKNRIFSKIQFPGSMIDEVQSLFNNVLKRFKDKKLILDVEELNTDKLRPKSIDNRIQYMENFFDIAYDIKMEDELMFNIANSLSSEFNNMVKENRIKISLGYKFLGFEYIEVERSLSKIYIYLVNYQKDFEPGLLYYDDQLCLEFDINNKNNTFLLHYLTYNYNL
ncbi:hypothetical protein CPT_MarsHill_223 [Staphylococcus phage MarsHill]|nr:hypothetical protein CPT_MarsHill_223 [Staphylococcus phage MarsHill]QQO92875.1 hypothetical protein CPT_Madawaska_226 [Staphylococcus phage Madawaska]